MQPKISKQKHHKYSSSLDVTVLGGANHQTWSKTDSRKQIEVILKSSIEKSLKAIQEQKPCPESVLSYEVLKVFSV